MNKYENILVDTVGRIKESFGGEALRNGKRLQGLCMDMSPQLMNQREYKMLVILIKCGGNEALLDALNDTPAVQERAVARLTQRMADEYVMDESAARRICALYMTAASGNSAYIDRLDAAGEAKRQPAKKPAPAPRPAQTPAPTPKPAPQKAADDGRGQRSAGKSKKWIIAALLAVILAVAAWQMIANRDTVVDDPARDKRMVEAWVKVNERVLADVKSTEFDYLNCTGPEDLKADLANRSGIYDADGGDMCSSFAVTNDGDFLNAYGEYRRQDVYLHDQTGEEYIEIVFIDNPDQEKNLSRSVTTYFLTADGQGLFSPYLPKYAEDISGLDGEAMLNYFGITENMLD